MDQKIDLPSIRKALGLTQSELATRAGVNVATVWRWENDGIPKRGPAKAFIEQLAKDANAAGRQGRAA